jgi:hypothetical protein
MEVAWVAMHRIKWDTQPIDGDQVRFYVEQLAGHDGHLAPPILNEDYTIRDGRHRLIAHNVLGRTFARCLIVRGVASQVADDLAA